MKKVNIFLLIALAIASAISTGCETSYSLDAPPTADIIKYSVDKGNGYNFTMTNQTPGTIAYWSITKAGAEKPTMTASGDEVKFYIAFKGSYRCDLVVYASGGKTATSFPIEIAATDAEYICNEPTFKLLAGGCELGSKTWIWKGAIEGWRTVRNPDSESTIWWAAPAASISPSLQDDEFKFNMTGSFERIDQDLSMIDWSWTAEFTDGAQPDGGVYGDALQDTKPYKDARGNSFTWTIVEDSRGRWIELSNGGWMGYYNGAFRYRIVKLTETELEVYTDYHYGPNTGGNTDINTGGFVLVAK